MASPFSIKRSTTFGFTVRAVEELGTTVRFAFTPDACTFSFVKSPPKTIRRGPLERALPANVCKLVLRHGGNSLVSFHRRETLSHFKIHFLVKALRWSGSAFTTGYCIRSARPIAMRPHCPTCPKTDRCAGCAVEKPYAGKLNPQQAFARCAERRATARPQYMVARNELGHLIICACVYTIYY